MELPLGLCAALRDRELVTQPERLREGEGEGEGLPEADEATEAVRVPEAHWLALREGE